MTKFITAAHLPFPASTVLGLIHTPHRLFRLNPLTTSIVAGPSSTYTLTLRLPLLFGLLHIPVSVAATFIPNEDGVLVTTVSGGGAVHASSGWTVVAVAGGCIVEEEFVLVDAWWGLGWFVVWTAKREHASVMVRLARALEAAEAEAEAVE